MQGKSRKTEGRTYLVVVGGRHGYDTETNRFILVDGGCVVGFGEGGRVLIPRHGDNHGCLRHSGRIVRVVRRQNQLKKSDWFDAA